MPKKKIDHCTVHWGMFWIEWEKEGEVLALLPDVTEFGIFWVKLLISGPFFSQNSRNKKNGANVGKES